MGALAPRSPHARPSAQPPTTLAEIFRRKCPINFLTISGDPKHFLEPYDNSFWEKSNNLRKQEREREKTSLFPWQRTQATQANYILCYVLWS